MNLGVKLCGFGGEFGDDFGEDGIAGLITVNFDK